MTPLGPVHPRPLPAHSVDDQARSLVRGWFSRHGTSSRFELREARALSREAARRSVAASPMRPEVKARALAIVDATPHRLVLAHATDTERAAQVTFLFLVGDRERVHTHLLLDPGP